MRLRAAVRAWAWGVLGAALVAGTAVAQEPVGLPDPGPVLEDEDFRVRTRQFGLDRQVEMYQWRRAESGGYERAWHGARIDSAGFPPDHRNPDAMPLESRRWWARHPTLDGKPLHQDVLRELGEWRVLHPNFSRLPANLAASFQPEGEGLGSAENPLEPRIGDVRVGWRELVLPPLAGKVELRDGAWHVRPEAVPRNPGPDEEIDIGNASFRLPGWFWLAGGILALVVLAGLLRRRR